MASREDCSKQDISLLLQNRVPCRKIHVGETLRPAPLSQSWGAPPPAFIADRRRIGYLSPPTNTKCCACANHLLGRAKSPNNKAEELIEELGIGLSSKKLKKAMGQLDPAGEGVVSKQDFIEWYAENGQGG